MNYNYLIILQLYIIKNNLYLNEHNLLIIDLISLINFNYQFPVRQIVRKFPIQRGIRNLSGHAGEDAHAEMVRWRKLSYGINFYYFLNINNL